MTAKDFGDAISQFNAELPSSVPAAFFQHPCDSATMTQLGENIARAADQRPSLQEEGVRHPLAEKESDPPN